MTAWERVCLYVGMKRVILAGSPNDEVGPVRTALLPGAAGVATMLSSKRRRYTAQWHSVSGR